jgi:hypothetical protein
MIGRMGLGYGLGMQGSFAMQRAFYVCLTPCLLRNKRKINFQMVCYHLVLLALG